MQVPAASKSKLHGLSRSFQAIGGSLTDENAVVIRYAAYAAIALLLAGCGLLPPSPSPSPHPPLLAAASEKGRDIVVYALGLVDTGYRYGGKNPEAGLDCSGMVSHVFSQAAGIKLVGSAADIARKGRPVEPAKLAPGDLVFFNTRNKPYSHVGIYIGDGRFVHAPNSHGRVRTESLRQGYFAAHFEDARSYFD
jgi:cell wall-associated NlpC family hydrolase